MEEFKEVHRQYKELTSTPHTIEDLRRDIKQLEDEKETLQKRLEKQKPRVQKIPAAQIELAKNYRQEVEKEEKLNTVKQDLHNTIHQLEQKIQRLERQVADQRSSAYDQSPEGNPQTILSNFSNRFSRFCSDHETDGRRKSSE
jgi:chromosome segregation ATPase